MDFLLVLEKVAIVEIWLLVEVIKINKQTIIQIIIYFLNLSLGCLGNEGRKSVNFCFSFKPILDYVNDQFESYLKDESGLNRRHIVDTRVHCCFYFVAPTGHG